MDEFLLLLLEIGIALSILVLEVLVEQIEALAKSENAIVVCVLALLFACITLILWLLRFYKMGARKVYSWFLDVVHLIFCISTITFSFLETLKISGKDLRHFANSPLIAAGVIAFLLLAELVVEHCIPNLFPGLLPWHPVAVSTSLPQNADEVGNVSTSLPQNADEVGNVSTSLPQNADEVGNVSTSLPQNADEVGNREVGGHETAGENPSASQEGSDNKSQLAPSPSVVQPKPLLSATGTRPLETFIGPRQLTSGGPPPTSHPSLPLHFFADGSPQLSLTYGYRFRQPLAATGGLHGWLRRPQDTVGRPRPQHTDGSPHSPHTSAH